jgi:hypothetical protein
MFDIAPSSRFIEVTGGGGGTILAYLGCIVLFGAALVAFLWQFYQFRSPSRDRRELIEQSLSSYSEIHTVTHRFTVEHKYIEELLVTHIPVEIPLSSRLHAANPNSVVELTDQSQQLSVFVTILEKSDTTMTVRLTKRPTQE